MRRTLRILSALALAVCGLAAAPVRGEGPVYTVSLAFNVVDGVRQTWTSSSLNISSNMIEASVGITLTDGQKLTAWKLVRNLGKTLYPLRETSVALGNGNPLVLSYTAEIDALLKNYVAGSETLHLVPYIDYIAYVVSYDANGGTWADEPEAQTVQYNRSYIAPPAACATRGGYALTGWNTKKGGTGAFVGCAQAFKGSKFGVLEDGADVTLYAQWTPATYALTVAPGTGGEGGGTATYVFSETGAQAVEVAMPTNRGHAIADWSVTGCQGGEPTVDVSGGRVLIPRGVYGDITLTPLWEAEEYTLTIDAGEEGRGGSKVDYVYSAAKQEIVITRPTRTGHALSGWKVVGADGGEPTIADTTLTIPGGTSGDITMYAQWTPNVYSLTVAPGEGGTGGCVTNYTYSTAAQSLTVAVPARTGYAISGWSVDGAYGSRPTIAGTRVQIPAGTYGDIVLTPTWEAEEYTLTIDAGEDGSGGSRIYYAFSETDQRQVVELPVRTGHALSGWRVVGASGGEPTIADTMLTIPGGTSGDITMYAQWTPKVYSLTVAPGEGGAGGCVTNYAYSTAAQSLTVALPTRRGHAIGDWLIDGNHGGRPALSGTRLQIPAGTYGDIVLTPTWEVETYTLTVGAGDGGTGGSRIAYTYSDADQKLAVTLPTRTGYELAGWEVVGASGGEPTIAGTLLTIPGGTSGDVTMHALWKAIVYTLTVAPGEGGTGGWATNYTYSTASRSMTVTLPTRPGCSITGWTADGVYGSRPTITGTLLQIPAETYGDIVLTPTWSSGTYWVTISAGDGGEGGSTVKYVYAVTEQTKVVTLPTKVGHVLAGWTVFGAEGGEPTIRSTPETLPDGVLTIPGGMLGNVTMYAQWTNAFYLLTVAPGEGGLGGCVTNYTYSTASQTVSVALPTNAGHVVSSWTVTGQYGSRPTVSGSAVLVPAGTYGDIVLTPTWEEADPELFEISVGAGRGGSVEKFPTRNTFEAGQKVTLTAYPDEGYLFKAWQSDVEADVTANPCVITVSRDAEYRAVFTNAAEAVKVTIVASYGAGGKAEIFPTTGKHITVSEVYPNASVPIWTPVTLTAVPDAGYAFLHWQSSVGDDVTANPYTFLAAEDAEYKAVFSDRTCQVTFDANGGQLADESAKTRTVAWGEALGELPVAENSPYAFLGWFSAKTGGEAFTQENAITQNLTLYAHWGDTLNYLITTKAEPAEGGYVTGGGSNAVGTVAHLVACTNPGWSFAGWSDGVMTQSRDWTVTGHKTFTAKFSKNGYSVTFDLSGSGTVTNGVAEEQKGIAYGAAAAEPGVRSTVAGWEFAGWDTRAFTNVTCDLRVTAQWRRDGCTLVFDSGAAGATGSMAPVEVKYGSRAEVTCGYEFGGSKSTFRGWALANGGEVVYPTNRLGVAAITNVTRTASDTLRLYAVWDMGSLSKAVGLTNAELKEERGSENVSVKYFFSPWASNGEEAGVSCEGVMRSGVGRTHTSWATLWTQLSGSGLIEFSYRKRARVSGDEATFDAYALVTDKSTGRVTTNQLTSSQLSASEVRIEGKGTNVVAWMAVCTKNTVQAEERAVYLDIQSIRWKPDHAADSSSCVISYENVRGAVNPNPVTYVPGRGISFEALPDAGGHAFKGWSPAKIDADTTGDVTVTALWDDAGTCDVVVDGVATGYPCGSQVTLATVADRKDEDTKAFCLGWRGTGDVPATGAGTQVTFRVTQRSTLNWQYETNYWVSVRSANTKQGTVSLTEDGESVANEFWAKPGATYQAAARAKEGFAFKAWVDAKTKVSVAGGTNITQTIAGPWRLEATWRPVYRVTFDLAGCGTVTNGVALVQSVPEGDAARAPGVRADDGWIFRGWEPSAFGCISNDLTVTAQYARQKHVVTIDGVVRTVDYGDEVAATAPFGAQVAGRTNVVCVGWTGTGSAPATGVGTQVVFTVTQESSVTWRYATNFWVEAGAAGADGTVTLVDAAAKALATNALWAAAGTNLTAVATAAEGWLFAGWRVEVGGATRSEAASAVAFAVDAPMTLRAAFTNRLCTVVFVVDETCGRVTNGVATTQTVVYGDAATAPGVQAQEGHVFLGWDRTDYDRVTDDLTVTALWDDVTCRVVFDLAGGTRTGGGALTQTVAYAEAAEAPTAKRPGHTFAGWDAEFNRIVRDTSVTAQWQKFALGDRTFARGVAIGPIVLDYGDDVAKIAVSGLPSGLSFTAKAKTVKGVAYEANTIYGTPSSVGVRAVTVKVTRQDRTVEVHVSNFIVTEAGKYVALAACDAAAGKVTGSGVYAPGRKVTFRATAAKGFVFEKWTTNGVWASAAAAYAFAMPATDVRATACFVTQQQLLDSFGLAVNGAPVGEAETRSLWQGVKVDWPVVATGLVSVTVSASGLPSGLSLKKETDKATGAVSYAIRGCPTRVTDATAKITVAAGSVKRVFVVTMPVAALPTGAVGSWNGVMAQICAGRTNAVGNVVLTATAAGRVTAKFTVVSALKANTTASVSFSATGWDGYEDGVLRLALEDKSKRALSLEVAADGDWTEDSAAGSVAGGAFGAEPVGFSAYRNPYGKTGRVYENPEAVETMTAVAKAQTDQGTGRYVVTATTAEGWPFEATVKVSTSGKVTVSGKAPYLAGSGMKTVSFSGSTTLELRAGDVGPVPGVRFAVPTKTAAGCVWAVAELEVP